MIHFSECIDDASKPRLPRMKSILAAQTKGRYSDRMAVIDAVNNYKEAALKTARYELLSGTGMFYAEIPSCRGVWAEGRTKAEALQELKSVLEAWIELRLEQGLSLPKVA